MIFQSTLPQGKWRWANTGKCWADCISIHTSAREVTIHFLPGTHKVGFQSTLPQGKWRNMTRHSKYGLIFQSTLPQGKWRRMGRIRIRWAGISIHTSAREVTGRVGETVMNDKFQSTLPQGKWQQYFTKISPYFYKIFTNIFEYTFAYYHNHLVYVKAHSNLFIFSGASLLVILCMFATRTCKLQE